MAKKCVNARDTLYNSEVVSCCANCAISSNLEGTFAPSTPSFRNALAKNLISSTFSNISFPSCSCMTFPNKLPMTRISARSCVAVLYVSVVVVVADVVVVVSVSASNAIGNLVYNDGSGSEKDEYDDNHCCCCGGCCWPCC